MSPEHSYAKYPDASNPHKLQINIIMRSRIMNLLLKNHVSITLCQFQNICAFWFVKCWLSQLSVKKQQLKEKKHQEKMNKQKMQIKCLLYATVRPAQAVSVFVLCGPSIDEFFYVIETWKYRGTHSLNTNEVEGSIFC